MISLTTLALLTAVPASIYLFLVWNFDYWRKRGVKGPPAKPFIGSFPSSINQKQHFADDIGDIYKKYKPTESFVGVYAVREPQILVLDPVLAHQILVTAFNHFHDNDFAKFFDPKKEPLFANSPFMLNGKAWKENRSLVTPGLTGSRIKVAYGVMQQVSNSLCEFIENESKMAPPDGINAKDLALRFTAENISDCVLGIKARSFTKDPVPIVKNAVNFTENNTLFTIYFLLIGLFPSIGKYYTVKFVPKDKENFFLELLKRAFSLRIANQTDRQDFMNHLLTIKDKKNLSDVEMASHTMTFIIDGLDTTSSAIAHCLLLLARNPAAQEKLHHEIVEHTNEKGELNFEQLNELPYLDACFHESLRIFSPAAVMTKLCTEPFELKNKNGRSLLIQKGQQVTISIHSFHHDPEYYENPEEFRPERFLGGEADTKKLRDRGVFLPFSDGPRMCLGMRFALVQSKAAIVTIVKNFYVKLNPKTKKENKLDPKSFLSTQDGGIWLDFEKRG